MQNKIDELVSRNGFLEDISKKSEEKLDTITKTFEDKIDDINRKFDAKSIEHENKLNEF